MGKSKKIGYWIHGHFDLEKYHAEVSAVMEGGSAIPENAVDYYECSECGSIVTKKTKVCHSCHTTMKM